MIDWMMYTMLSREGRVACQNQYHRRRVGNLELEKLEYSTGTHQSKRHLLLQYVLKFLSISPCKG